MNPDLIKKIMKAIMDFLSKNVSQEVAKPVQPIQVQVEQEVVKASLTYSLVRKKYRDDGIFSELYNEKGVLIAHTLEHSYDKLPKIPMGSFKCVRGPHRLHGMTEDFITFEITGVVGHTNILFHWGNFNKDSEGCVLLGQAEAVQADGSHMVTTSKVTWQKFMDALQGVDSFTLVVK